ncbi:putative response regulator protein GraR, partial [Lacticaseibacillus rhamnosus ATCC 21052]
PVSNRAGSRSLFMFVYRPQNLYDKFRNGVGRVFKIMIVEDDQTISGLIADNLKKWQFEPVVVTDFNAVFDDFLQEKPHLVLLDINLPVFDGYYWVQKIREVSKVPVIFISSRNTNMDMVMAMNMGADDFLNKPFAMEVLIAKINALLRRTYNYADQGTDVLEHNGLMLNLKNGMAQIGEKEINLSKNEYKLLQILMRQHGQIVSRSRLLRDLWQDERFVDDNTLTVNVNRLRKKIEEAGLKDYIQTKVGQGYIVP